MNRILAPEKAERAYEIAAIAFRDMWRKVTGETLEIIGRDDGQGDLIVLGSDAVNGLAARALAENWIDSLHIRYGTDDYALRSVAAEGRSFLFLAGGRGRSTLYAVYDYFERAAGCHYFWDGDVIARRDSLEIAGFNVGESPRFAYRGLRYFAHRGLHRFQAEHWSLEDWEREIDWLVKRRLNFFMLRIGIDDLFQRAFPDLVPYPSATERLPEAEQEGYDDRTLFWPLEYRGILRQQIQQYARERDLMEPEDCGTMTHWYSRTPVRYLDQVKPAQLAQADHQYTQRTGLVWDPRVRENLENYMKLTETYCTQYGEPRLFHTIGLAERSIFKDRRENLNIKLFTYHRIMQEVFRRYPDSKLMLASWDFLAWWHPEDVRRLVGELDPERTLILDYTSEGDDPEHCFLNWGIMGQIPWIFGIFHAYERQSSIRGPYDRTAERLAAAREDGQCKGMIFWPELSHSDTLVLEYLARNSWKPEQLSIEKLAESFSNHRYGSFSREMNGVWQLSLPLFQTFDWGGCCTRQPDDPLYERYGHGWQRSGNFMSDMLGIEALRNPSADAAVCWRYTLGRVRPLRGNVRKALEALARLPDEALGSPFIRRDAVDIARSLLEQRIHHGIMRLNCGIVEYRAGADNARELRAQMAACMDAAVRHAAVIGCHEDYSMQATLERLESVCPVNPIFETTLKHNLVNPYCRQAAYEPETYLFLDENRAYYDWVARQLEADNRGEWTWDLGEKQQELYQRFMKTPINQMRPPRSSDLRALLLNAAEAVDRIDV